MRAVVLDERRERIVEPRHGARDFEIERRRNGRVVTHALVRGGTLFRAGKDGVLEPGGDPEPWRADLRLAWDPWSLALAPFRDRVHFTSEEEGIIDSRPARRYRLDLLPGGLDRPVGRIRPSLLEGLVWLDAATSVPLLGEAKGRWAVEGERGREHEVSLVMVRSDLGTAGPSSGQAEPSTSSASPP